MILFDQFAIKGTWDDSPDPEGRTVILMPPVPLGVHGGGWHRSTQASLIALRQNIKPGQTFLDFGTGTGIISVAAAKLGASKVYATEKDSRSVDFAVKVFEANGGEVEFLYDIIPPVDLCIANVGKMVEKLLQFIDAELVIGIDGDGMAGFITRHEGKKRINLQYMLPDESDLVLLRPSGVEMPLEEAAQQMVAYLKSVDIQAALDVQFGPGKVKLQ